MSFTKAQIIHIVVEAILIVGLAAFVIVRTKQQSAKINELENELRIQKSRTDILEAVVQEILRDQNPNVKQRVSRVVQNVRPSNNQTPVQVQARQVQQVQREVEQPPPPPPRANPLESMMAMMAPMMSSLVIGGDEVEPENHVEIEEQQIDDSEIAEELEELNQTDETVIEEVDEKTDETVVEEVSDDNESPKTKNTVDEIDAEIENEIASLEDSSNENNDTKED
jgi:hypothetical protein